MTDISFSEKVRDIVRRIPKGRVMTYADVAHALGSSACRAVGNVMKNNQHGYWTDTHSPRRIPCHRVVGADGRIGGFSYGLDKKIKLLADEGIKVEHGRIINFERRRLHVRR